MKSPELQEWKATGEFIKYKDFNVFVKQLGDPLASPHQTLLLIHGFPESSFSFHKVVNGLLRTFDRIVLLDMIGYGWSDKPLQNYSYSLLEQADVVLKAWKHFEIKGGHVLAHDMGVSVTTEIVHREVKNLLPGWLETGIKSYTFTNGSMVLEMASLRITQKILLSRFGSALSRLSNFPLFKQQVRSAHGNSNLTDETFKKLWDANCLANGHKKVHLTIRYLNDRKKYEKTRWLPALSQTKTPIHLCWGSTDEVARVEMAHYLHHEICPNSTLTIMDGLGHFCQLGSPEKWVEFVSRFYKGFN